MSFTSLQEWSLCLCGNFPTSVGGCANLRLCENQLVRLVLPCLLQVYQKVPQWEILFDFSFDS